MPKIKAYIHFVWSTKNREPFLSTLEIRQKVWYHIKENARTKDIYIDTINGHEDHCHCLISLGKSQSMATIMNLIKGESAYWINRNGLCEGKFGWQDEYFAISVSDSQLDRVRAYIRNQEDHHAKRSYQEEYEILLERCGVKE